MTEMRTRRRPVLHRAAEEYHTFIWQLRNRAEKDEYIHNAGTVSAKAIRIVQDRHAALRPGQTLRYLELGPGWGNGLSALEKFPRLEIHTLGPTDPVNAPARTVKHIGLAEEIYFPASMDVIHSRCGALMHGSNSVIVLENALRSLRQGGQIVIHPTDLRMNLGDKELVERIRAEEEERITAIARQIPKEPKLFDHPFAQIKVELRERLRRFQTSVESDKLRLENEDGFFASYALLKELERQGFGIPNDEEFINAAIDRHFERPDRNELVITRNRRLPMLQRFYENPHLNQVPIRLTRP